MKTFLLSVMLILSVSHAHATCWDKKRISEIPPEQIKSALVLLAENDITDKKAAIELAQDYDIGYRETANAVREISKQLFECDNE